MKDSKMMGIGSILLGGVLVLSLVGIGRTVIASGWGEYGEREHERERHEGRRGFTAQPPMSAIQQDYVEECGSCHMAYPAGLLPPQSWIKIMSGLENHFDENAELDAQTGAALTQYLVQASAPREGQYRRMFRNLDREAPLRITELPYFRHEHDEIPSRFIKGNDKVGSLSQCNSCHRGAERGWFDEDNVVIPGVGRWDD
jgi:hypothetical protein